MRGSTTGGGLGPLCIHHHLCSPLIANLRPSFDCCMSPYRSDHITIPRGCSALRAAWLYSTAVDGRCTFLFRGLAQDCLLEMFPEFTQFILTAYAERTPSLNVRYIFLLPHLIVGSISSHKTSFLKVELIAPIALAMLQLYRPSHQPEMGYSEVYSGHPSGAGHVGRRCSWVPS